MDILIDVILLVVTVALVLAVFAILGLGIVAGFQLAGWFFGQQADDGQEPWTVMDSTDEIEERAA